MERSLRTLLWAVACVGLHGAPQMARAQTVGGHLGVALPLITAGDVSTDVTETTTIVVPVGIGVRLSERVTVDFETAVFNPVSPVGPTSLLVDPGIVYSWGAVATGLRVAFQIGGMANVGLIPLIHLPLVDFGKAAWFIEAVFPAFYSSDKVSVTAAAHTGLSF